MNFTANETCATFDGTLNSPSEIRFGSNQGSNPVKAYYQATGSWNRTLNVTERELVYDNLQAGNITPGLWVSGDTSDITPPVITNLRNTSTTNESSHVEWDTDEGTNYTFELFNDSLRTNLIAVANNTNFITSRDLTISN